MSVPPGTPAAPLHHTHPPASSTDATSTTPLERARQAAVVHVQERFPGVHAWWGRTTNRWWAYVPDRHGGRLLESVSLDDLMVTISQNTSVITYERRLPWTSR
ncbi:hypothetical protein [Actinomadura kijaniata]|uniref:hypothetical protein n=1 Tax=Actinomadura kijaniata TaxID=46161 RepID=UPI0012FB757E|nr:hypothetical protein [Actinomadura kijaniata]